MTPRQEEVISFISKYKEQFGIDPTRRDICSELNICDNTVRKHIYALVDEGHIEDGSIKKYRGVRKSTRPSDYNRLPVNARDYGYHPNAPTWTEVMGNKKFDEIKFKPGNPVFVAHAHN